MTPGDLLIIGAWQTFDVLVILAAARMGVVSLSVRRPPRPKAKTEVPGA